MLTPEQGDARLACALGVNRLVYESLSSHYRASGPRRAMEARRWLRPVYERAAELPQPVHILEIGSADGFLTRTFTDLNYEVWAIDFAEFMVQSTRTAAPKATVLHGEFLAYDFKELQFDLVVAMAFIHLLPAPWDLVALQKMALHI